MKKYIIFGLSVLAVTAAFAFEPVWLSSNTATVDTTQVLCGQYAINGTSTTLHGIIHEVVVSSISATGTVTLYNSTSTATGQSIGPILTTTVSSPYTYDVTFPGGLIYSKTGGAQVQIIYACY